MRSSSRLSLFAAALSLAGACHAGELPCAARIEQRSVVVVRTVPGNVVEIDLPDGTHVRRVGAESGKTIFYKGGETEYPVNYLTNVGSIGLCALRARSAQDVDRHIVLNRPK